MHSAEIIEAYTHTIQYTSYTTDTQYIDGYAQYTNPQKNKSKFFLLQGQTLASNKKFT